MNNNRLSLEVFRDANDQENDNLSLETVLLGVRGLEKIVGNLDIVSTEAKFALPTDENQRLDILKQPAVKFDADINLVVTSRFMFMGRKWGPTATSTVTPNDTPLGMRLAVVPPNHMNAEHITTHELLHLINVKTDGETFDGEAHCTDRDCKMYPTGCADGVCNECTEQAVKNCDNLLRAKSGEKIAQHLILPPKFDELRI